jgi:GMP synthase (glutamine-hydrolysing)
MNEQIVILDFGSQYTQVIARRVRECNVYSTILRYDTPAAKIAALKPRGIILSGGPSSVYAKDAPLPDKTIFELGVPVLGICYGVQLFAQFLGGKVEKGQKREYGKGTLTVKDICARCSPDCRSRCRSGIRTATSSRNCRAASNPSPSRRTPLRRHREPRAEIVRPAIPSRSRPHAARQRNHFQLRPQNLRLRQKLDDAQLRRAGRRRNPRQVGGKR